MEQSNWTVHEVTTGVVLRATREMPTVPPHIEAEIAHAWCIAQRFAGGRLFNGRVFSADVITPAYIYGHWTEFRRVIAQMQCPTLFTTLKLRPLAVGGLIVGADFIVFGRRPPNAVYQANEWQLPPAGSIDPHAIEGARINPIRQLYAELAEELGMPSDSVTAPRMLAVVEHPGSHVCDLGIALSTSWTAAAIGAAHATRGNGEYRELAFVQPAALPTFLLCHAGQVTRQAQVFLSCAGLLPAQPP